MKKPKVIGVGGVFFKAKKPENLRVWYRDVLGFHLNPYGSFEFRNANDPEEVNYFCGRHCPVKQIISGHQKKIL